MSRNPLTRSFRTQRGASLLEVLIAVLILAIGMLGIAALQSISLRNTQGSSERSNAVIQSYSMLDMMRANRGQAVAGEYDQEWLCAPLETATAREDVDVNAWIQQLHDTVGETACGRISCNATNCTVTVRWDDSRGTGGSETQQLETESRL